MNYVLASSDRHHTRLPEHLFGYRIPTTAFSGGVLYYLGNRHDSEKTICTSLSIFPEGTNWTTRTFFELSKASWEHMDIGDSPIWWYATTIQHGMSILSQTHHKRRLSAIKTLPISSKNVRHRKLTMKKQFD